MKHILALTVILVLVLGLGCSNGSSPILPDKDGNLSPEESLNAIDLSNLPIAEYTYTDTHGNVIAAGTLGRDDNGNLYVMENRGAQFDIDLTPLGLVDCGVTYKNPAGTAGNGLPYFYKGTTMEYDINVLSYLLGNIGTPWAPANVYTEMRRAYIYPNHITLGNLMIGEATFNWYGTIHPGINTIPDTFYISPYQPSGNFATTVRVQAPIFFGLINIIWFDGIGGVFDP